MLSLENSLSRFNYLSIGMFQLFNQVLNEYFDILKKNGFYTHSEYFECETIDQLLIGRTKCDVRVSSLNTQNSVTNVIYWNPLGSFAPGGPQWTLQSFSNTITSGTTTAPNYYEGSVSSSTSISLSTLSSNIRIARV